MKRLFFIPVILMLVACVSHPKVTQKIAQLPSIYPDYTDITIPMNIAPLNFLLREDVEAVYVLAECGSQKLEVISGDNSVRFDIDDWKSFLRKCVNKKVSVQVISEVDGKWKEYKKFSWKIVADKVDPYLTYRLIEPDYEIFNNLQICERCVENFDERAISDFNIVGNHCMNCHVYGNQNQNISMMYIRGEGGGAILNRNGKLRKLNIKTDSMYGPSVYAGFDNTGRYIVFSTNIIIPAFHSMSSKRLEVYDSKSDIYVADLDKNKIFSSPLLSDSTVLETFPTFSPQGKYIYFCTAPKLKLPEKLKDLKYNLCRISFDGKSGRFGKSVDTIYNARITGKSVCHPRISSDGKYLLYTVADYGTFPIWHREADLQMIDLKTRRIDPLTKVNSNRSDTYHSWSSNSRWFVFASKRDDGLYGKPYFCYIDRQGLASKPFLLPQEDPTFYDYNLKSFNIPDLGKGRLPFNIKDVENVMKRKSESLH